MDEKAYMISKTVKLSDIHPAEYNPRVALQPGDKEYEALQRSIERFGMTMPLVVNMNNMVLISGHQRYSVLKAAGTEEVEAILIDVDEDHEKLLNVALNKIEGDWDYQKLEKLFSEIAVEDIEFTGFEPDEIETMFDIHGLQDEEEEELEEEAPEEELAETYEDDEPGDKPFYIYMSFATEELANEWLKKRDIEPKFGKDSKTMTIKMEGYEYGI